MARADARFLLPQPVRSATVLDGVGGWGAALAGAGIDLVEAPGSADLVVAPASSWREAVASGASGIVLEGADMRSQLTRSGLRASVYLPVPSAADPTVLLPLGRARISHYALTRMAAPRSTAKAFRNQLLGRVLGATARLPGVPIVTVAGTAGSVPALVQAAARELGPDLELDWLLVPGRGDLLARATIQVFPPGASEPGWAVKFSRVRGHADAFDRDEHGLALAAAGGPNVRRHVPRLVARFAVDGIEASLETAAIGATLTAHLHGRSSRARKLAMLDTIAAWVVQVGADTAQPAEALAPELARLARHVVPEWGLPGAALDPETQLADVPASLQHDDLGSWNIVVDGAHFTILDWEDARPSGVPLWDLLYLLMDALAHLDGVPATIEDRERHFTRLFRGELEASRVLFHWVREAAATLGLRRDVVPRLASLCWMHHGLSSAARREAMARHGGPTVPAFWLRLLERLAHRWLTDPALGPGWPAWHQA